MKKIPHTFTIVFGLIVLAAVLTWVVPAGEYTRVVEGGREVVLNDSFHRVDAAPQTWQVFSALFNGFVDKADILIFILMVGGAFWILNNSHAIDVGVMAFLRRVQRLSRYKLVSKLGVNNIIITLVMLLFSLFGAGESAVPSYAADGLAEAIVDDPLYQQKGPAYQKRIIARENGAYAIEQAVARALLPVRSSILGKAAERLPLHRVRQILWTAVVAMWALTLLCAGLILLLNRGQLMAGVAWAGAGLVAGSLAAFAALIPAAFLRVTETVAQVSEAFAQSAAFFTERLTLCHSLICLVPLAAGLLLMRAANGVRPKQKNEA